MRLKIILMSIGLGAAALAPAMARAGDVTCAASSYHGLTCLTATGIKIFTRKSSPLPRDRINLMTGCGDRIFFAVSKAIIAFDGVAWSKPMQAPHWVNHLACRDKTLWISGGGKVSTNASGQWKTWGAKEIFVGVQGASTRAVAAGPKGTAWVVSNKTAVALFNGSAWKLYKEGAGFDRRYPLAKVAVDRKGRPWLAGGYALLALDGGTWKIVARPGATRFVQEGPQGNIWIGGGGLRVAVHTPGGSTKEFNLPYRPSGGAVDAKGRLWVATRYGIGLWRNGKLDMRQMHNSMLADNNVQAIAVAGNGGAFPATITTKSASVSGQLVWRDGAVIGKARVQLCGSPAPLRLVRKDRTPCQDLPFTFLTRADGDGKFRLDKVPAANYRVAVEGPETGKWVIIHIGRGRDRVAPGATHDFGKIRVSDTVRKK